MFGSWKSGMANPAWRQPSCPTPVARPGVPIVASRVGGLAEMLADTGTEDGQAKPQKRGRLVCLLGRN